MSAHATGELLSLELELADLSHSAAAQVSGSVQLQLVCANHS